MDLNQIFDRLWTDYTTQNPSSGKIYDLFIKEGEKPDNDHIAFRTLDYPEINIEAVAKPFLANGYVPAGEYIFKEKHLFAKHFELPGNTAAPRVFISQLILSDSSGFIRNTFDELYKKVDWKKINAGELIFTGTFFDSLSFKTYNRLREESEYAAWFYVFGFRANHFTVSINSLKKYNDILKVNDLLKKNGYLLNTSGGEVKGTPSELLQQSSTMADIVKVNFKEGLFEVPSCYYEFAQRHADSNGKIYSGFIAKSADKIFESTNYYKKPCG